MSNLGKTKMEKLPLYSEYYDFDSISESNSYKKSLGVIGPLKKGGYKIKVSKSSLNETSGSCMSLEETESGCNLCSSKTNETYFLPRGCYNIKGSGNFRTLETLPDSKHFSDEEESEKFDDFVDNFIQSQEDETPLVDIQDDVQMILDLLGLDISISEVNPRKENSWTLKMTDGSEVDVRKKSNDDFIRSLKIFMKDNTKPSMDLYKSKEGLGVDYRTKTGTFYQPLSKISDLKNTPMNQYLSKVSLGKIPGNEQNVILDDWKNKVQDYVWKTSKNPEDPQTTRSQREVESLKKILSNSVSPDTLDEIYYQYRMKK